MRWAPGALVVALVAASVFAGAADAKHKPKPYRASGHVNNGGQDCFAARFAGNGGYSNNLKSPAERNDDTSNYSWDVSENTAGAGCALSLLPGFKPTGAASFDAGSNRIGWNIDNTAQNSDHQWYTVEKCQRGLTEHQSESTADGGGFTLERRGDSLVFVATVGLPSTVAITQCPNAGANPFQAVVKGPTDNFLTSSSAPVPINVFKNARDVAITISSDSRILKPNCGYTDPGITCIQKGNWQGTLTLYQN